MTKTKQCLVCGKVRTDRDYDYQLMFELFELYRVCDVLTICSDCHYTASKFFKHGLVKIKEDRLEIKNFLRGGVLPNRQFQMQMNGGYCEQITKKI